MTISLVGSGNLATSLAHAICLTKHHLDAVWSRSIDSAQHLASQFKSVKAVGDIAELNPNSDIFIIAVKDNAIQDVAKQVAIHAPEALIVHTAGSISIDTIPARRKGVFYPMQTFSKQRIVSFKHIPIFLETGIEKDMSILKELATALSDNVRQLDGEKRKILHLAAVFCCNFTNHCNALAEQILKENDIPFSVMMPLLKETVLKLEKCAPMEAQTGPAARNDTVVMKHHMKMLDSLNHPEWAQLYQALSQSILNLQQNKKE